MLLGDSQTQPTFGRRCPALCYPRKFTTAQPKENKMAKSQNSKKQTKKAPLKSAKEKKLAKREKKSAK
jgi:hypothetical protein